EEALELRDIFRLGALEGRSVHLVVSDEVDIGAELFRERGELDRVFGGIVHAAEEGVFESDLAPGLRKPFLARDEEFVDGGVLGPGNELAANRVGCGVKGEGEGDWEIEFVAEFLDGLGETDR